MPCKHPSAIFYHHHRTHIAIALQEMPERRGPTVNGTICHLKICNATQIFDLQHPRGMFKSPPHQIFPHVPDVAFHILFLLTFHS